MNLEQIAKALNAINNRLAAIEAHNKTTMTRLTVTNVRIDRLEAFIQANLDMGEDVQSQARDQIEGV
ncbi:hypothetical protein PJI17_31230, partial [Mycobacterium kansasii]